MTTLTINCQSIQLTDEQFYQLSQDNRDLKFERTATGELIIMPPTGGETGNRNIEIAYQLQAWSRQNNLGLAFDSSTGFKLPNGANRSPDASWISLERWNNLSVQQQKQFIPLCPEFVIELRSPSDNLAAIRQKMEEYRDNGTRLGWLINRQSRQIEIYRQNQEVEILDSPMSLSGEDILPGFELNLEPIW
ncbi:MAG: Uma2 family endonuclease [Symploca sp. SIO2E9]|nr:Uma2 family endonuclease [Symploca sp. SIO2E9]